MRLPIVAYIIAFYLGCLFPVYSQRVFSLHPLFTEQSATLIPQAGGSWSNKEFGISVKIKKAGDNFYFLEYGTTTNPSRFEAIFVKIGNSLFLNLLPLVSDTLGDGNYRAQLIPSHELFKMEMIGDQLRLSPMSYAWFYKQLKEEKVPLSHQYIDNALLLTLSTDELHAFLQKNVSEADLFKESFVLKRDSPFVTKKVPVFENVRDPELFFQNCKPIFPLKDGWLGGDGNVSVPINSTQTIFLFSDTYVGKKDATRQDPFTMIPNSAAISTCNPKGEYGVQYFWNGMYGEHPEPIFRSHTNRYKYWVSDAFFHNGSLYVLLQKIAPKKGVAPGDVFGFTQLGFSLAKISNPIAVTPDKWEIELVPFSYFFPAYSDISAVVKEGSHLYFFAEKSSAGRLVRLALHELDSAKMQFEFYSEKGNWAKGMGGGGDGKAITSESPGHTVKYHADLKKWIMVCGPGFMDRRIGIRTAASLTGPWSELIVVHDCPEQLADSPEYVKNGFTYLGRECIQYYNKKEKKMIITYDWNADFPDIVKNPLIYTPRVIEVSLKKFLK